MFAVSASFLPRDVELSSEANGSSCRITEAEERPYWTSSFKTSNPEDVLDIVAVLLVVGDSNKGRLCVCVCVCARARAFMCACLLYSKVQLTEEVREQLKKPTFDNWQWDDSEMLILLRQMFLDLGLVHKFNIQVCVLYGCGCCWG